MGRDQTQAAAAMDLAAWKAFGGTVDGKVYVAPGGERLRSRKAAAMMMADGKKDSGAGKKRAAEAEAETEAEAIPDTKAGKENKGGKKKPAAKKAKAAFTSDAAAAAAADGDAPGAVATDGDPEARTAAVRGGDSDAAAAPAQIGSGRRAAQGVQYGDDESVRARRDDVIVVEDEPEAASEGDAVRETQGERPSSTRRLVYFTVTDKAGMVQPLDRLGLLNEPLLVSGAVYPEEGPLNKPLGRRVTDIGPVKAWSLAPPAGSVPRPVIRLTTQLGCYTLSRPLPTYKKVWAALQAQAALAVETMQAVDPACGGNAAATFDEVVSRLARHKTVYKGYGSAREALLLNGRFILEQLAATDATRRGVLTGSKDKDKGKGTAGASEWAFCKGLEAELAKGPIMVGTLMTANGGIKIADGTTPTDGPAAPADGLMAADEEMARRLQAQMDAQAYGSSGGNRGRSSGAAAANAYIKISEEEIADDYPMPKQYDKEEEEMDELALLWDEELAQLDPDVLPRRLITDFSVYNAEGFMTTLELLPMWAGVDPDVEVFMSGVVKDDDGDWGVGGQGLGQDESAAKDPANGDASKAANAGGSGAVGTSSLGAGTSGAGGSGAGGGSGPSGAGDSGAGGSSSAGGGGKGSGAADPVAPADPVLAGGTRMFLSQIREWVVEYSADQLFLSVRTDAGWYRLCRPAHKYAPWFRVPLKAARLAVKVIGMLAEAERASRLSFPDVVRRLAEEAQGSPLFVSKNRDRVERFVVVHGQIFLNQIKAFPKQSVQRSPFVTGLKAAMEARRHNKLYYSKKGFSRAVRVSGVNRNPMKARERGADRASGRAKPMPATATRMVLAVWENYFGVGEGGSGPGAGGAAAAVAKEVEEDPNEEDDDEESVGDGPEDALAGGPTGKGKGKANAVTKGKKTADAKGKKAQSKKPEWVGASTGSDPEGRMLYRAARVGSWQVALSDVVQLPAPESDSDAEDGSQEAAPAAKDSEGDVEMGEGGHGDATAANAAAMVAPKHPKMPPVGLVQCLLQNKAGEKMVRMLLPGFETVLGDAAADAELFVTDDYVTLPLAGLPGVTLDAKRLERDWSADLRGRHFEEDEALRKANRAAAAAGQPLRYFYRTWYRPQHGMFRALPEDLGLGTFVEPPMPSVALGLLDGGAFVKDGVEYRAGEFLFLQHGALDKSGSDGADSDEGSSSEGEGSEDGSGESSEGEEGSEREEEEEQKEAKPAPKGKRQQPTRGNRAKAKAAPAAKGKGKAAAAKGGDEDMADADASGDDDASGSGSGGDDSGDEDFKARGVRGAGKGRKVPAAAVKKGGNAAAPKRDHKAVAAPRRRASGAKGKDVCYADGRKGRFVKGSCEGLRAWAIGRVVEVRAGSGGKGALPASVLVARYYRPEDVSPEVAYAGGFWDLYAPPSAKGKAAAAEGPWLQWVKPSLIVGKCATGPAGMPKGDLPTFEVVGTYDPTSKAMSSPPAEFVPGASGSAKLDARGKGKTAADKGKGKASAATAPSPAPEASADDGLAMATMDIFAGCGGLSEGMHQAGVADTRWAIEYEAPAADAFKLNNPKAEVFCANCNVILRAAMEKAGLASDCCAHEDAIAGALAMAPDRIAALPRPGEVEFIMGGPPCQGYSGMNRFNKGNWSMVQNSMVMAFLSYADFYRPRYFLLENVRNFVSHNKSFTFRLTLRTLLDMGYQVRFGVLNAGNYGVPQSRKRTFIWAAAPGELLPEWPQQQYVFRSPQLTINLPGGVAYTAVPQREGAPLRTVTVRDAIGDLPAIKNGHDTEIIPYSQDAVSGFQKKIRNGATMLRDHICKEMNPLNLERCRCIPKNTPGADWRVLLEIVNNDPSREKFNGQPLVPWCLPNTADRHNGWRGLFGRLDMAGHFPTSTTDPQPMGKVGQVFHPDQDRIVSVRECARSQGFPDTFFFSGNVHNRHRQVGNAVPPPLAAALGGQLRRALVATHAKQMAGLAAQMGGGSK